jgi:hypothetical protein
MRSFPKFIFLAIAVIAAVLSLWTWFTLSWSYADGDRAGVLQKFSKKGWICKTYEGELALYVVGGVSPQIWYFSARDESLAEKLSKAVGQRMQVHYTEHKGIPGSCFGDTQYFAEGFTALPEK